MIVFIRNIPGDTLRSEIADFVKPALKGGFFRAHGAIMNIQILKLRDKDINLVEYHALVFVEPDTVALRVIRMLHGKLFRGKRTTVRQYMQRNFGNDRRQFSKHLPPEIKEKRRIPTRRRNLEVEELELRYSTHKSFHRIY